MKHITQKNSNKAFTLIEIMVAIAIVGILAAVVLVSMSTYGKKARASKVLAQLSSAMPSLYSCAGNFGWSLETINWPGYPSTGGSVGGVNICKDKDAYGKWPKVGSGTGLLNYSYPGSSFHSSTQWHVSIISQNNEGGDGKWICCNGKMNGCTIINWNSASGWEEQCTEDNPTTN